MSEKLMHGVAIATEATKEIMNSPKIAVLISTWIVSIHWLEVIPEFISNVSTYIAFATICLVVSNQWLIRKKTKLEIQALKENKPKIKK